MKKFKILIIVCTMILGFSSPLASYLPANFTSSGNPILYEKLHKLAHYNLHK